MIISLERAAVRRNRLRGSFLLARFTRLSPLIRRLTLKLNTADRVQRGTVPRYNIHRLKSKMICSAGGLAQARNGKTLPG
jgi:hypothetical protein